MASTTMHPTKIPMMSGMMGPTSFGGAGFGYPTTTTPFGPYNPSYPMPPMTPPAAFFPPMSTTKFPSTGFPPGSVVPPPGIVPPGLTGFGDVFEPEPFYYNLPPYSYRGWPASVNVGNVFGPSNPMTTTSYPPMMMDPMTAFPTQQTTMHGNQTLYNMNFRPANWVEFYTLTNPVRIVERDGSRMLFLAFDLRGFKPEEINVTLHKADRSIVVEANYEFKDGTHQISRRFFRKFVMPDYLKNVDINKVDLHSSLNVNGMLMIEAMLPRMSMEEMSKWTGEMHINMPFMMMPGGGMTMPAGSYPMTSGYGCPVTCRPVNQ